MLDRIREYCLSGSPFDVGEIFANLNNDIISRVAMGKKYSGEESGRNFKKIFHEFLELMAAFNVGDYIPWLGWINHINGLEAKVNRVASELDSYVDNIAEEGINRRRKFVRLSDGEKEDKTREQDFLDVLLEIQEQRASGFALHRDSLKAILLDMFIGGTDTVTSLLEWVISELMKNKNVMTKLTNEVRRFANGKQNCITEDDIEKLPYLTAVIKETLRMHPPAPMLVPRESRNTIKIMGYEIFAGTQVIINAFAIGRDPSVWDNANEFQPERFLNNSIDSKGQHFQLIPFGSGRRSCPGYGFAWTTVKVTLANYQRLTSILHWRVEQERRI
ncbi:OLC1v1015798C1 [Oldenlandia corymbosa var. corymbosa]|uniref:OLC1v1015798C1 n=1 Tax=Oldenlandia corymbosa var. corymbosa TaxID=529605 RepID=A0AAV1E435_OLDCO|nr:OLC1v1015798C1 [Oldenlandia corymbosa var. corymbosa]